MTREDASLRSTPVATMDDPTWRPSAWSTTVGRSMGIDEASGHSTTVRPAADCEMALGPLLALLRLVSPALPVGGYSYSRGLESAVDLGWVHDELSASDWISAQVERVCATTDAPILGMLYHALLREDNGAVARLGHFLQAFRESAELRAEDHNMGLALARLLHDLGSARAAEFVRQSSCSFVTLFALAAVEAHVPKRSAISGYLWLLTESQVSAAVRLVPLGQTAGQRILQRLLRSLPNLIEMACTYEYNDLDGISIGNYMPGLALASALHETQYARLFRS